LRPLVLMSSNAISTPERWFACARLLDPYLTNPIGFALSPTLTTTVFSQCRSGRFQAGPCRQTPEGHDSSITSVASHTSRMAPSIPIRITAAHANNRGIAPSTTVQARDVEAGEPHIAHDDDLERVLRIAETGGQCLAPGLVADVLLPLQRIGGRAGHHHLHPPLLVVLVAPVRPQGGDLAVQIDADAPAHALLRQRCVGASVRVSLR
jgi:hypothetical protein